MLHNKINYKSEPGVHLIKTNASDLDVARAAWVSTMGEDAREHESGRVPGLIRFLWSNGHTSPFEHGSFTFMIDCPLFVAREFMRHRTFSYNETSGRYRVLDGNFYVPARERPLVQTGKVGEYIFEAGTDEQYVIMMTNHMMAFEYCWTRYEAELEAGIAKEVARDVLPVSLYTQFYATCNPLNLMKFLDQRTADDALYEIRQVADIMKGHFKETMPLTYKVWSGNGDIQ